MMAKPLLTLIALLLAAPVAAQQSFAPPQGCTGKLTVQHRNCVLVNVWTCAADPAGHQWLALIGQNGLFSVQRVDDQFQWLESYKLNGTEILQLPAPDPASLDELFATQLDTWDFTLDTDAGTERHVGFDMLTGETIVIDGETLLVTEFQGRTTDADGNEIYAGSGRQYVSENHRLFFLGEGWEDATPDQIMDSSPVEFIYPGEAGFFADQPRYECNVIESGFRP
ncbi:hypothetical protein [Yoonia vestfoldensis]|uniref:Uncharacterized protein n=1 Tax=Yoonia vestfoldensis TaxID=245188 RepID=A0A1Y0EG70_9RHOB|nr:hypothetical protein [Yoonia vestfoldensis]ARU02646.1 hypothetical protein LOKVESSMR4R_03373 [Yoonia vestfoldensis]